MEIATLLFTYNRSWHTQKTLDALSQNSVLPENLLIFQDGLKREEDREEWEKVKKIIHGIDWCNKEIIEKDVNAGLAKSIVKGINYAFAKYDAVIVLEDDCVSAPDFMGFMVQCFEKYKDEKQVYSVSGYSWPINVQKDKYDIYFTGRISSWGWGTWKDRWEQYEIDNDIITRVKNDKEKSLYLATWGNDLEQMFTDRLEGKNDSWAVYWGLKVIEKRGKCVAPYISLIQNIGCDGSGVHSGISDKFEVVLDERSAQYYSLPDDVNILDKTAKAFAALYGSQTAINVDVAKTHILVYGMGRFFSQNEKCINDQYYIEAFVDKGKEGYYAGRKIIKPNDVELYQDIKIVIMIQNIQECLKVAKLLRYRYNVLYKQIIVGSGIVPNPQHVDSIVYTEDDKLQISINGIRCKVRSIDEYNNVLEVLAQKTYLYYINNDKKDVVIDIGMNIGDATLFFLNQERTKKVYGYEPFYQTYLSAEDNLREYLNHRDKLEIFQYGISNENGKRNILYNQEMSCGQSTMKRAMEVARDFYERAGLISRENDVSETIEVRKASEIFLPIIKKHEQDNLVLKMDCEGDEYEIMENLLQEKLLDKFEFIMLEWHYRGKESLLEYLSEAGFSYWCNNKSAEMGLIYAYRK